MLRLLALAALLLLALAACDDGPPPRNTCEGASYHWCEVGVGCQRFISPTVSGCYDDISNGDWNCRELAASGNERFDAIDWAACSDAIDKYLCSDDRSAAGQRPLDEACFGPQPALDDE